MASSLAALRAEVLGHDTCAACGACVGLCPYILALDDNVAAVGDCRIDGGRCYRFCPRTGGDSSADAPDGPADPESFAPLGGDVGYVGPIGRVIASHLARAVAPASGDTDGGSGAVVAERPTQHGGTVSALVRQALRDGLVRTAVLTADSGLGSSQAVSADTEAGLDACRGSKFAVSPVVAEANRALTAGRDALGVVALPCQATALAKMRASGAEVPVLPGGVSPAAGITLVVGLFCTWALGQEGWSRLAREHLGPGPFRHVDIPPPPAEVLVAESPDGGRSEAPLAEVRGLVRPGCRVCMDMTAENADVSVGMAETEEGWNTLLVRTSAGERLVARAVAAGLLELRPTSDEGMAHLEGASLGKKRRAAVEAGARLAAVGGSDGSDAPGPEGESGAGPRGARGDVSPYLNRVASWKGGS